MIRRTAVGVWVGVLAAVASVAAFWGVAMTPGNGVFLVALGLVPPAVMLLVWRGAPPATVAEVLHATERRN
jgi:hypothetical protein